MKSLHLIISGLFPPQEFAAELCNGLAMKATETLLARGRQILLDVQSVEELLEQDFGIQGIAPFRAKADGLDVSSGYWMCADPITLHLQRAEMVVMPLIPTRDEATAMIEALNTHFAQDGVQFYAPTPGRWYIRLEEAPLLLTYPLSRVAWLDAKSFQPQGADALRWQQLLTEIQMLLYGHPLNQAREQRREAVVGSLWLWGGGQYTTSTPQMEALGGGHELAGVLANIVAEQPVGKSLPDMLQLQGRGLWLDDATWWALRSGNLQGWRRAATHFEQECAQSVLQALRSGKLGELVLDIVSDEGVQRFTLDRRDVWKFWKTTRALAGYAGS